jgi:hypothetical protein
MDRIRLHPFIATLAVAVVVIIAGAAFVVSRAPVAPTQNSLTWGGGTPVSAYQSAAQQQSPQQIVQDVIQNRSSATLSLPPLSPASSTSSFSSPSSASNSTDYVALLAQLSGNAQVSAPASQTSANAAITAAYQFIPTGLVATTAPAKKPMTAGQQAIYDYGNSIGGEIQSFEQLNPDEAQILKDQAEDRTDQAKSNALISLGKGFASIGTYMNQMQDVPTSVMPLHSALAQSYLDIGAKLQLVAQAQSDADFVQAIETYDTTANTFVRNYGAMAQFFQEQGIVFAPQDPGSVFSFTDTSGAGGL